MSKPVFAFWCAAVSMLYSFCWSVMFWAYFRFDVSWLALGIFLVSFAIMYGIGRNG